jgi:Cu2+-exporting ATPase
MSRIALALASASAALLIALAARDPLAAANLTSADRAMGLRSVEFEVNGTNCRFCRINVERSLQSLPGVKIAKADMPHHRARVVFDPQTIQAKDLIAAVRDVGVGANLAPPGPGANGI